MYKEEIVRAHSVISLSLSLDGAKHHSTAAMFVSYSYYGTCTFKETLI